MSRITKYLAALLCSGVALAPVQAFAQSEAQVPAAEPQDAEPGEVVVTAQKREQLARDVPLSITAVTGDLIEQHNITDYEQLSKYTPGLMVSQGTDSSTSFVVRGIEAGNAGAVSEPSISFFLNDVDTSRSRGLAKELYDIERVEIARGPQGTLYGRGSEIGAIAVYTNKADTDAVDYLAEAQYGNYNLYQITGMVNVPIVADKLAIRVAGRRRERDGYTRDLLGGPAYNDDTMTAIRGSLRFQPSEALRFDLIVDHQSDDDGVVMTKAINLASPGGDTSPFSTAAQNRADDGQPRRQTGVTLLGSYDLGGGWALSSITGWRSVRFNEYWDADGTTYNFLNARNLSDNQNLFSQELRMSFDQGGAFRTVFGVSYYHDKSYNELEFIINEQYLLAGFPRVTTPVTQFQVAPGVFLPVTSGSRTNIFTQNVRDSYSAYANVSFDIASRLTLDAGARFTHDKAHVSQRNTADTVDGIRAIALANGLGNSLGQTFDQTRSYDLFQPRAALTYKLTDRLNLYAGASRGQRAGYPQISFGAPANGRPTPSYGQIDTEQVVNIEGGIKGHVVQPFYVEATVFTYDYKDFQTLAVDFTKGTVNAGQASAHGLEFYGRLKLARALSLYGTYTYLDTQYDDFKELVGGVVVSRDGNKFRLAPAHSFTLGADVSRPIGNDWQVFANANYQWRSDYFYNNDNLVTERQEAFGLLDLRIGLERQDRRFKLELYGENLTDTEYNRDIGNAGKSFGVPTAIRGTPRFYGVRLTVRR